MTGAHYTRLRGRVTYFRRRTPVALRKKLASSEICIRLGVINRNDAQRLGRRLAAATDSFFEDASMNPILDGTALIRLVEQTIKGWRTGDDRTAARDSLEYGLTSRLSAKDKALIHAGLARDALEADEQGRLLYDDDFVREKFREAGVTPPEDPIALAQANQRLGRSLAVHYLETAIATARRHGLDADDRDLPLHKWQDQAAHLRKSLGLDKSAMGADSSCGQTLQTRALQLAGFRDRAFDHAASENKPEKSEAPGREPSANTVSVAGTSARCTGGPQDKTAGITEIHVGAAPEADQCTQAPFPDAQSVANHVSADVCAGNHASNPAPHMNAASEFAWVATSVGGGTHFADAGPGLMAMAPSHAEWHQPVPSTDAGAVQSLDGNGACENSTFERSRPQDSADAPAPFSADAPASPDRINANSPFSKAFEFSLDMRKEAGRIGDKQRHTTHSSLRIWLEALGDRCVGEYTRHDMVAYRSLLKKVPVHYWRSPGERQKTIQQIIKEADARAEAKGQPVERLGPVTINKHLSNISSFFEWAHREHILPESTRQFWYGLQLPKGRRATGLAANEERPAYSDAQLAKIFRHPIWMGRASEGRYTKRGDVIVRDALYWAPLIAVYSLMRREEICQLKVRHVCKIDGVWVFNLWHHELDLKNIASKRYVPVHQNLIDLGLIDSLVGERDENEQLFHELTRSAVHNSFGDAVGKKFARVIDSLGIVVMRKDGKESHGAFHPLRHYGETMLLNAGISPGIVDAISGHSSIARERATEQHKAAERDRYMKGYFIKPLKAAIDKLEAPIDIAELKRRYRHCKRVKVSGYKK